MRNGLSVGCISSFVPKKCGIATFSRDLTEAIKHNHIRSKIFIAAAENPRESYTYYKSVVAVLKSNSPKSYRDAANTFNKLKLDVILLEHEFGLFGGKTTTPLLKNQKIGFPLGDNIFELINNLDSPIITTLHTVVAEPDRQRKQVIQKIAKLSSSVITMTQDSKSILHEQYGVNNQKIVVIPHGVPRAKLTNRLLSLKKLGLDKQNYYLLMSGLLGDNKGVRVAIKAMPDILKEHPNVKLLIVGQVHPEVLALRGEYYFNSFVNLAKKLKIESSVIFINKYLKTSELMTYFSIADIYLTPYKDPEQAASGTLAYAIGSGLLTISTRYRYAKEILAHKRGFFVPFNNSRSISVTVNRLMDDAELRKATKKLAKSYGKQMSWPIVGRDYLKLIKQTVSS